MRANVYQIKYIIRFLLLWIIFQVTAAAEDTCSFKIIVGSVISKNVSTGSNASVTLSGIQTAEQCGQKCCDTTNCSAAMFGNNVCLLVDCSKLDGGCTYEDRHRSQVSLIRIARSIDTDSSGDGQASAATPPPPTKTVLTTNTSKKIEETTVAHALDSAAKATVTPSPKATTASTAPSTPTSPPTGKPTNAITTSSTTVSSSTTVPTSPPPPTPTTGQLKLSVTTGGNQQIRLPKDSVTIHADVKPKSDKEYDYHWRLIKHPEDFHGTQSGIEKETLKLTTLTQGDYQFKVEVKGENSYGEAFVNVTVLPKLRVNTPPVAVISPPFQELTLPTDSTLLDGSKSHDDDGIEVYEWEEVEGPLQSNINKNENGDFPNEKVLKITGLVVGNYTFKLTVTDTDKATNSTLATIVVKKKIDNPPIANAGSNQVIQLPQNSAKLCGNDSTDDWGIKEYKWSLSADSKTGVVDMQGARTKCIVVSNLEAGDYTFQLTVTDEAGQEDTAKVTVIVQPESNHPPVANAGEDQQLLLPLDNGVVTANLDGTKSKDDKKVTSQQWKMTSGPQQVTIVKPTSLETSVTGITKPGKYVMTLTVTDADGASNSDNIVITVKAEQPPTAIAGLDIVLILPDNVAMLDGSKSTDDYGITDYQWTRTEKSPAAGFVLNKSDHQSVFHVAGLVQGTYTFVLKVTNVRGKSSEDQAKVTVKSDPLTDNLVELHLDANILRFDEEQKQTVIRQLQVLLQLQTDDQVIVRDIFAEHGTGHMVVLFYVKTKEGHLLPALEVQDSLNSKLKSDVDFLEFKFLRADTFVCENLCSGHGRCHSGSHECECDLFWMEDFFRVYMGDGKRNCDWSVLYVGIITFILITIIICGAWFLGCYCVRRRTKKPCHKRRKNYQSHDKGRYEKLPMKPHRNGHVRKNGYVRPTATYKSSSIMRSISSSSSSLSDSDNVKDTTLFERKRLLLNGGGRFNGAFDLDTNPKKIPLRKSSSSSRNSGTGPRFEKQNGGFGHQSTVLKVGNSSDEEVL